MVKLRWVQEQGGLAESLVLHGCAAIAWRTPDSLYDGFGFASGQEQSMPGRSNVKASRIGTAARWSLSLVLSVGLLIGARSVSCEPLQLSVHGLWVWKSPDVLRAPQGAQRLRDFCMVQGINEIYVAYSAASASSEENDFILLIGMMHRANIRVEALLSSTDADEPGKHREQAA